MPYPQDQHNDSSINLPPVGDPQKAEKYLNQLIEFIRQDKLLVSHTDLKKFDPSSLQDHYQLELQDYQIEVSHSKQADSGKDFYTILFNNLKNVREGCHEKIILAYLNLTSDQFQKFRAIADLQIEKRKKEAEEKRFNEAIAPIEKVFRNLTSENDRQDFKDNRDQRKDYYPRENNQASHQTQEPKSEPREEKPSYQKPDENYNQHFNASGQPTDNTNSNYPTYPNS